MEKNAKFLVLTALCFYIFNASTHARDFLSIDCGAAEGHTDELGLEWVTDDGFIQTGTNLQLLVTELPVFSLKYFPEGRSKNCYVLPVKNETTYLIRAFFYPGNQSTGRAIISPLNFNITVNNNLWYAYVSEGADDRPSGWIDSVIHTFGKNEMYVCLLKGTEGYPFINSLELRELNITSYREAKTNEKFLVHTGRYNTGTRTDMNATIVRYPDDPYDRIWSPTITPTFPAYSRVEDLSLEPFPEDTTATFGNNWPPPKVLQDAWVGRNLTTPRFFKRSGVTRLFVVFYFKEIRRNVTDLEENPVGLLYGLNGELFSGNITDEDDFSRSYGQEVEATDESYFLAVQSPAWSKRDAILNAFEVYASHNIDASSTYSMDREALIALQKSFKLQDWTGDPCYPVAWDWVSCDPKTSRINKLELSSMNISGSIPDAISELTQLIEIRLDNNNLTGPIPTSMSKLNKLQILALDNNNLSGDLPSSFQSKSGFTFSGNPGLCLPGNKSCGTSPASAPASLLDRSATVSADMNKNVLTGLILALGVIVLV